MDSDLRTLYKTLTPGQIRLATHPDGILTRDLLPLQQKLVYDAMIHAGFGDVFDIWELLASQLAGLAGSSLTVVEAPEPRSPGPADSSARPENQTAAFLAYSWHERGRDYQMPVPHPFGVFLRLPQRR